MRRDPLNSFSEETRDLFYDVYACYECGRSDKGLTGHHICQRGNRSSDVESSPLNLGLLCEGENCHKAFDVNCDMKRREYLKKTFDYLMGIGYTLTEKDKRFIDKYKRYYV